MKAPFAFSIVLALASPLFAQTPPAPPTPAQIAQREVQRYTTLLSLNAQQEEQALTIFTAEAASESNLRTTERTTHQALDASIKTDNTSAIEQAATALGQIHGQMLLMHATAEAKFYQLLTGDQQTKFAVLRPERPHMGGPGQPPPPPM